MAFIILLFLIPVIGFAQENEPAFELNLEELRQRIYNESPNEIISASLGSADVSLFLTGSWKGELQFNPGYFFSPMGSGFASSNVPIYTQEADLTLALWINERWFVEANFLDDSSQNTYRAGYQGKHGEFLQYAGIGNTGNDFPAFPYMDLGGDSPGSFGFYSRFGNDKINVHTLIRYDSASREERTFSGSRERTYSYVQLKDSVRGISFVLPDTDIDSQITVYIEDEKGALRDSMGRRWRHAQASEYAASRAHGLLELSVRPEGAAAVSYSKGGDRPWNNSMGSYDGTQKGFLSDVQSWFDAKRESIKLENFPQAGNRNSSALKPGEVFFNEGAALVIYEAGAFSPFERRNRYDAPSSSSEQAALISLSSETEINGYDLIQVNTEAAFSDIPVFSPAASQRNVYELIRTSSRDARHPGSIWPLVTEYPEIYLPGAGVFSGDAVLRFTNFYNTNGYFIGNDVVPGSVQVWRSGIQDTNFNYNASSGEVVISGAAGQNELIRITYLKRSEETRFGSFTAGAGAVYNNMKHFSMQGAVGLRMNLSDESFTEDDYSSMGNVAAGVKAAWDFDFLKAYATGGLAFVRTDTTGLYRASGMEGNETIINLPHDNSFISNPPLSVFAQGLSAGNRADLIYRNYFDNNILGSSLMSVDSNVPVISGINKPYPAADSQLGSSKVITAEFNLYNDEWTGFQVPLNSYAQILPNAGEIEIPFRFYGFNQIPSDAFKVILQIGSLSGEDFAFTENPDLVWEKILYSKDIAVTGSDYYTGMEFNHNARIARFTLNDEDKRKLGDAKYLRLIAVCEGNENISGRVLLASPIVRGASFRPVTFDAVNGISGNTEKVKAIETIDTGASLKDAYPELINRLHYDNSIQRVLRIDWQDLDAGISAGVDGRLSELPLSDYRELSFFVKIRNEESAGSNNYLSFILADGIESTGLNALEAKIPMNVFEAEKWHKVVIRYQGGNKGIFADGNKLTDAFCSYNPKKMSYNNKERKTSYIAVLVNPENSSSKLKNGTIFIDEIILEDSIVMYRINAGAGIEYSKQGSILSVNNFNVLSDFSVFSAVESEMRSKIDSEQSNISGSAVSRTGMKVSFLGINMSGNFSFTAAEDTFLWDADHDISRAIGSFFVKETFSASPHERTARHTFNMRYLSNFYSGFEADVLYDLSRLKQNWKFDIGYRPKNEYIPSIAFNTQALWTKKSQIEEDDNYGSLWARSWLPLIPDSGTGAESRKMQSQIVISENTKPVGAVITLDGSVFSSDLSTMTRFENSAFLDIPVVLKNTSLNFRTGRNFKQHINYSGESALDDSGKFFKSINDSFAFWKIIPFYSLFTSKLNNAMDNGITSSPFNSILNYMSFNDHFSARVNLLSMYNIASLFVPSRIIFRLDRVIEQKMDTRADALNINGSLGFSSINMFGAMGRLPLFKFYQSDEFSHSLDAALIVPRGEDNTWRAQSVLSAGFRGFSGGAVNFVNTFTIRSDETWLESFTIGWEAPTKKSFTNFLYSKTVSLIKKQSAWLKFSDFISSKYEQLRRESLELLFDKSTDYLRWSVIAGHEEIIRILGRLNFTTFIKLKLGEDLYTDIFKIDVLLGTGLRISF